MVYTDHGPATPVVQVYDLSTGTAQPLPATSGSQVNPGIDGALVAYEYTPAGSGTDDIWATDLTTGQTFPITSDGDMESGPEVSGQKIVFARRLAGHTDNDIILYDVASGTETVVAGTAADETDPAIDGNRIVYDAIPAGRTDRDVYIYDLTTGATTHLDLPGNQFDPRVSGDVVAFDDDSTGSYNVMLYYVPTGYTYPVTTDSNTDYLNDIDGGNLVYTSDRSGNPDIWLFKFTVNVPQTGGTGGTGGSCGDPAKHACTDDSALDPVFSGTYTRGHGKPKQVTDTFDALPGDGVVVIRSDCASATATLDGRAILSSCELHPGDDGHGDDGGDDGCRAKDVTLGAHNTLQVKVASKPGCQVAIDVYAAPQTQCGGRRGSRGPRPRRRRSRWQRARRRRPRPRRRRRERLRGDGGGSGGTYDLSRLHQAAPHLGLVGCATGPGAAGYLAFALVLFALGLRRRPAPRPVRVRSRRR